MLSAWRKGANYFFAHNHGATIRNAIILEDDCLPHESFFSFCAELLDLYKNEDQVSVITGNNFQRGQHRGKASYYFSKYNHCWGWATWRRAWNLYDGNLQFWPSWRNSGDWARKIPDMIEREYWKRIFDKAYAGKIDTWDYPWTANLWYRGGLTAIPNVNLVSNIGFGSDATHTSDKCNEFASMPTSSMEKINHPELISVDAQADKFTFDHAFGGKKYRFPYFLYNAPKQIVKKIYHDAGHLFK